MLFKNVLGQEPAARIFENILKHGRLAHAYLFVGPMGVGKFRFARELAKILLCAEQKAGSDLRPACDRCPSCRQADREQHPNLRITRLAPDEKSIKINDIRRIEREIIMKPIQGKRKIFIINDAESIVEEGFNALLKTLEEPPGYSLLILVTNQPDAILPTVFSRCQLIRFSPLGDRVLRSFFHKELKLNQSEAEVLAHLAQGSIGWGCYLQEHDFIRQRACLLERLGDPGGASRSGLAEEIIAYAQRHKKSLEGNRQRVIQQFKVLALFFYDVLLGHYGLDQYVVNQDQKKLLRKIQTASSPGDITRILEVLMAGEKALKLNANYKLVVENAVCQMNFN